MPDHPYEYSQHPGHYPPPTSGSSNTQSFYSAQQVGATPPTPYTASQSASAFEFNSTRIPGLGLGGAPATTTTASTISFPSRASQPWPVPVPVPVSVPGHVPQTNAYFPNNHQPPSSFPPHVTYPPSSLPPHLTYQEAHSNTLEEGELSEGDGEFEDLYEPGAFVGGSQAAPKDKSTQASNKQDSRNTSMGDGDDSSIYDPHDPHITRAESPVQATTNNLPVAEQEYLPDDEWEPSYPDRDRSGSYSPYLSPREVHRKISLGKTISRDNKAADQASQTPPQAGLSTATSSIPVTHSDSNSSATKHGSGTNGSSSPAGKKTLQEAKKKAQEAILELWPYKVRYQDYLDEGLDANVVKHLFKDLGLDVPSSKTAVAPAKATSASRSSPAKTMPSSNVSPQSQSPPPQKPRAPLIDPKQRHDKAEKDASTEARVSAKSAAEERKDKIARKLAAIGQKATTAQPSTSITSVPATFSAPVPAPATPPTQPPCAPRSTVSGPSSVPTPLPIRAESAMSMGAKANTTGTPPAPPKTRAENNAILQQKLAALKKQQAQLAADKARGASSEVAAAPPTVIADLNISDKSSNGGLIPKTKPVGSVQNNSNQPPSVGPRVNSKDESIPGLSFSSIALTQPTPGSNRGLKRPVASDFDNYTPRFEPPKRSRTEERLIIDVSDDEDVEMDIGSPVDELSPSLDTSAVPTPQAPTAFPPSSDGSNNRQQASPASSSVPTPPVHGTRIDILHKRIEETKRLIAEAEAKKAAKKGTAQHSPNSMSPTIVNLPKANEGNADEKGVVPDRRDRIASYELPRVNATLKDKQDKLKLVFAEVARLELEVQASLDEKRQLTVEMAHLETSTTSSKTDEQSSGLTTSTHYNFTPPLQPAPPPQFISPNGLPDSREEHPGERPPDGQKSPSTSASGDMATELSNDEALQAAILTDNTNSMDVVMTDADASAPIADNSPVAKGDDFIADSPGSMAEKTGPVDLVATNTETAPEQITKADTINATTNSPSREPDHGLNKSGDSVKPCAPDLSQSDDESYEPQISEVHDAPMDEQESTEVMKYSPFSGGNSLTNHQVVVDDTVEEPNPNQLLVAQNSREAEHTANEVNNRVFEEPPLLTASQDNDGNMPALKDLPSYKSPLSYFRAYRFHPKYFEEVPGGLKSMTFSARIDPMREMCPHVLAGELCPNGPDCEYQHFDSMILAEAEIITQLGSADMFAGETKTKFIEGLKRVLHDLKTNRVKDFDRITRAIVKHRQEFLGDQTRVLALDSSII